MRTIKITNNEKEIKELLVHNYDRLVYDNSTDLLNFHVTGIWFILYYQEHIAGFITLSPLNNVTWMPHILIYKKFRGRGSEEWGKQVVQFMSDKFGIKKFIAFTPYATAKKHAEAIGFKCISVLKQSIKKDGKLLDQYVLEL